MPASLRPRSNGGPDGLPGAQATLHTLADVHAVSCSWMQSRQSGSAALSVPCLCCHHVLPCQAACAGPRHQQSTSALTCARHRRSWSWARPQVSHGPDQATLSAWADAGPAACLWQWACDFAAAAAAAADAAAAAAATLLGHRRLQAALLLRAPHAGAACNCQHAQMCGFNMILTSALIHTSASC